MRKVLLVLSCVVCASAWYWVYSLSADEVPPIPVLKEGEQAVLKQTIGGNSITLSKQATQHLFEIVTREPTHFVRGPSPGGIPLFHVTVGGQTYIWNASAAIIKQGKGKSWSFEDPRLKRMGEVLAYDYGYRIDAESLAAVIKILEESGKQP